MLDNLEADHPQNATPIRRLRLLFSFFLRVIKFLRLAVNKCHVIDHAVPACVLLIGRNNIDFIVLCSLNNMRKIKVCFDGCGHRTPLDTIYVNSASSFN